MAECISGAPDLRNVVAAFSEEQVERLTGLTKAQLRYWDGTGFFQPKYADEDRRQPFSRLYSFKDVVVLRALGMLRNEHKVPLQHLRKVADKLSHLAEDKWIKQTLYVLNKKMDIALKTIISDTKKSVQKIQRRDPNKVGHIDRSRFISRNAWVVGGTRIPTAAISRFKEAGYTTEQIIAEYPGLTVRDIRAALWHERERSEAQQRVMH